MLWEDVLIGVGLTKHELREHPRTRLEISLLPEDLKEDRIRRLVACEREHVRAGPSHWCDVGKHDC